MKHKIVLLSLLAGLSQAVSASESSDQTATLKQQIKILTERLDKLEKQPQEELEVKTVSTAKKAKPSIADRLTFKADFRDRYEIIDQQGKDGRERNRFRLRAALSMKVNDQVSFTLGTATGGDDPVSTNQTLGDGFSTKDVRLDLAYFEYKLNDSLSLTGGKMKNPFHKPGKTPVFWDGDLNPEGFALKFDNKTLKGTLVGFQVDERKTAAEALMFGGQVMHDYKFDGDSKLTAGIGYYDYSGLQGSEALFDGKPRGNTVDANGNYVNDYDIFEGLLEYKTKVNGTPFTVYGNYLQNTAADTLDTAYTVGLKYGKVKGAGTWDIGLAYLDVEADAVVGLFNDSDFAGGNTDSKGFLLKAGYGIKKNMALGIAYIDSEIGQSQASQSNYNRLQMDFKIKFK